MGEKELRPAPHTGKEFSESKPFAGKKVTLSVHLEAKTAYLCLVLAAGGAEMYVTGSNPLSTQDDVAAALVKPDLRYTPGTARPRKSMRRTFATYWRRSRISSLTTAAIW